MLCARIHRVSRPPAIPRFPFGFERLRSQAAGKYYSQSANQIRRVHLPSYLVSPEQLNQALRKQQSKDATKVIPVCASWFLPNDPEGRTGRATFKAQRIPGARFFDLDHVKDPNSRYPHMLPSNIDFAKAMGELGIGNGDTVVVYDSRELGIFSAPRVGWTLKAFGHDKTHVLNNFRLWVEQGYATDSGEPEKPEPKQYDVPKVEQPRAAVDFDFVKKVAKGQEEARILDARPKGRFEGKDPEPRPGLPSGHIPNSTSLPFSELLDPKTKAILPPEKLKEVLSSKGINANTSIVSSCGTGVTAAIIDTALRAAGYPPEVLLLYDGSWTEWAQRVTQEENLIKEGTS